MARSYTMLDLIRFATFSKENEGTKPIDRIKAYNAKYPELSAKQKWENVRKYLGDELGDEIERAVAKRSDERRALTLADVMPSVYAVSEHTSDDVYGYFIKKDNAEKFAKQHRLSEYLYVHKLSFSDM